MPLNLNTHHQCNGPGGHSFLNWKYLIWWGFQVLKALAIIRLVGIFCLHSTSIERSIESFESCVVEEGGLSSGSHYIGGNVKMLWWRASGVNLKSLMPIWPQLIQSCNVYVWWSGRFQFHAQYNDFKEKKARWGPYSTLMGFRWNIIPGRLWLQLSITL